MVITYDGRRYPHYSHVGITKGVLTRVAMGLISATPLGELPEGDPWGAPLGHVD
jgi:hypothetical protein